MTRDDDSACRGTCEDGARTNGSWPGPAKDVYRDPDTPHAAVRWARAIVALTKARDDPRTLGVWAHQVGVSTSQLRSYCALAGLNTKRSLDFARLLRAFSRRRYSGWSLENLLDYSDPRTIRRLLMRAGLADQYRSNTPDVLTPERFVTTQQLISDPTALNEVLRCIDTRSTPPG
jgi:hypothetical protein